MCSLQPRRAWGLHSAQDSGFRTCILSQAPPPHILLIALTVSLCWMQAGAGRIGVSQGRFQGLPTSKLISTRKMQQKGVQNTGRGNISVKKTQPQARRTPDVNKTGPNQEPAGNHLTRHDPMPLPRSTSSTASMAM